MNGTTGEYKANPGSAACLVEIFPLKDYCHATSASSTLHLKPVTTSDRQYDQFERELFLLR
jgi:hypothetical protein